MATLNTTTSITDYLKSQGKASDFTSRSKMYKESGLENRLGSYMGSGEQNTALLGYLNKQTTPTPQYTSNVPTAAGFASIPVKQTTTFPTPATPATPTQQPIQQNIQSQQVPQPLVDAFQRIQQSTQDLMKRVQSEGITDESGKQIISPQTTTSPTETTTPPITTPKINTKEEGGGELSYDALPSEVKSLVDKAKGTTTPTTTPTIDVNAVKLQDTDLADLMNMASTGQLDTPELKISEEAKRLALEGEDRRVNQVMNQLQQQLAKSGMSFSGIRNQQEENVITESLANKAGISNEFASVIVKAARAEQTRRDTANQEALKAQETALAKMGYVKIGDQLFKTIEKEESEQKKITDEQKQATDALEAMGYTLVGDKLYPTIEAQKLKLEEVKLAEPAKTADVKEYEYATSNGYFSGGYTDWLKFKDENLNSTDPVLNAIRLLTLQQQTAKTTPSQGQLVYSSTQTPATQDLPATFVERVNVLKYFSDQAQSLAPRIQELLQKPDVNVSSLAGALKQFGYQGWGRYVGLSSFASDNEKTLFDLMSQLNNEYLYARSGAQINEKESARLGKTMPQAGLTNQENANRLNNFVATVRGIIDERLSSYGVEFYKGSGGGGNTNQSLRDQVIQKGYDYDSLSRDYSDEEIRAELGL